ncbi:MAG TPA: protein kinase [Candidatus Acidoferrales bacterium]
MPLSAGTKLGPYEILAPIGAGGMGEVYRAKDARLGREVAVKILPSAFALDPERLRRFTAEAQAVAALNHPNILAIHDVGEVNGSQYLVMEFLDGESLRERLAGGALAVRKSTEYAEQIAKGLAAAHDKGIVHRDLKPDNIFVTRDGHVKILDFGLAKLTGTEGKDPADTMTRTSATQPGVVLGTVGYMSPEQVRGQVADQRSDIFSFGAIFYEMLSGKRAFTGNSSVEVMSAILKEEPPPLMEAVRQMPPALDRIVHHCLEKNPAERFQSARDVAFNIASLSDISSTSGRTTAGNAATAAAAAATANSQQQAAAFKNMRAIALVASGVLLAGALAMWFLWRQRPMPVPATFERITFSSGSVGAARFTADGQTIIFDAVWEGGSLRLYQWRADTPQAQPMGTDDTRVVGVSKSNELALLLHVSALDRRPVTLARMPLSGGAPRAVLESVRDATWSPDEQLAVVHVVNGLDRLEYPIGKVLYETSGWISNPRFSPDGKTIAILDHTTFPDTAGTVSLIDLNGKREVLTPFWDDTRGLAWAPSGKEVWYGGANASWDNLRAVDLAKHDRLVLELPALIELKDIAADGRVLIDARNHRLPVVGRTAGMERERDLSWLDVTVLGDISRDGKQILLAEEDAPAVATNPFWVGTRAMDGSPVVRLGSGLGGRFSADGKWATAFTEANPLKIWVIPLSEGEPTSVAVPGIERLIENNLGFFPDGKRIWLNGAQAAHAPRAYAVDIAGGTPAPITPEGVLTDGISDDGQNAIGNDAEGFVTEFPLGGGPARRVPGVVAKEKFVQCGPDGRSIYVRDFKLPTTIYQVNLTSGQRTAVLKLIPLDPAGVTTIFNVAMTRDGKSYAYGFARTLSQLLVVKGLK